MSAYLLQVVYTILAVALPAFVAGRLSARRAAVRRAGRLCTCGHARAFHQNGTGTCRRRHRVSGNLDGCQLYDGPPPLPSLEDIMRSGEH